MPVVADHVMDANYKHYYDAGVIPMHDKKPADFNPYSVRDGDTIFVKTDFIVNGDFGRMILPKIFSKFNLITGISSYKLGRAGGDIYKEVLNHPALIKWYCTNPPDEENEKIVPLPIGFEEPDRVGGNQDMLQEMQDNRTPREEKKDKILLPYHDMSTNLERQSYYDKLKKLPFVETQEEKLPPQDYLKLLDKYKFVICLEGRGPDVHRNYEAMLVGSIPINIRNSIEKVFKHHYATGVFVDSWQELDEKFYKNLLDKEFNINQNDQFLLLDNYLSLVRGNQ